MIAENLARLPDHIISGPELPADETVRKRLFGEGRKASICSRNDEENRGARVDLKNDFKYRFYARFDKEPLPAVLQLDGTTSAI